MRVGVVVFPGSNCEYDALAAMTNLGADAELVWHSATDLDGFDEVERQLVLFLLVVEVDLAVERHVVGGVVRYERIRPLDCWQVVVHVAHDLHPATTRTIGFKSEHTMKIFGCITTSM